MPSRPGSRARAILQLAIIPTLVVIALFAAWKLGYFQLEKRRHLAEAVQAFHHLPWSEATFVVSYAVAISLGIPAMLGTVLGGALFGFGEGTLMAWLGAMTGTILAHLLARTVARGPVRRLFGEHRLLRMLKDHDDVMMLFRLRILPVAPFAVLDYVAGIAGVSLRNLVLATMVGILPSILTYSYAGAELLRGMTGGTSRRSLWIAGSVTVIMLIVSAIPAMKARHALKSE